MEIEKPFKCTVCGANFTNEDHLQVHKRKHEMSLALGKTSSQSTALESFTDETPTPTRFFQNCEEVGLFQDLQSVNPFDEQFSKATCSTTIASNTSGTSNLSNESNHNGGGHGPFDFSLAISSVSTSASTVSSLSSVSSTGNHTASASKRRYSDQDTLNTPQVFGYIVNSTSSTTNTCSTSSVLTPMPPASSAALDPLSNPVKILNQDDDEETMCVRSGPIENTDVRKPIRNMPTSASILVRNGSASAISNRNKTNLKLNLSPNIIPVSSSARTSSTEIADKSDSKKNNLTAKLVPKKKAELLERNRAAAVRSRERRKQWVSNLESKCESYELMIAQLKSQVTKQNNEIQLLKNELSKHADCDVTKGNTLSSTVQPVQLYVQQPLPTPQPNILRSQVSVPVVVASISSNCATTENYVVQTKSSDSSFTPVLANGRIRARRGRPRKGEERRVHVVSVPASSSPGIPLKIQLVPLPRSRPQSNDKSSSFNVVL